MSEMDSLTEKYLLDQAAAVLRADGTHRYPSARTLRRRIKDGSLPFTKVDGAYCLTRETLDAAYPEHGTEDLVRWFEAMLDRYAPLDDVTADKLVALVKGVAS